MFRNTENTYGLVAKTLHWISALLIFGLLSAGFFMTSMAFSEQKFEVYTLHKSFGTLLLGLVGVRVLWRLSNPEPKPLKTHQAWELRLSKAVHIFLYGLLITMPLSGWIMSSAGDFSNSFFGLFEMPDIAPKDKALFALSRNAHEIMAFTIIGIVGIHIAGGFKHYFIDRDETLQRMTLPKLKRRGGLVLAVCSIIAIAAPITLWGLHEVKTTKAETIAVEAVEEVSTVADDALSSQWNIIPGASTINFEVTQYGQPFTGTFKNFTGQINFDPDNLGDSHANITIDIASIDTGSDDRDGQARSGDWFDTVQFPQAHFVTTSFTALKPNHYEAMAELTIRGVKTAVTLPFTLEFIDDDRRAKMAAVLTLKRLDFGVGQGQWQATDAIADDIQLDITLEAERAQ